jgi:hypothetical protein
MARLPRLSCSPAALAAAFAAAGLPAQAPPAPAGLADEVKLNEFGLSLRPPAGWVRVKEVGPGVVARFTGPAPNADGRVLELVIFPIDEAASFEQVRDRAVAAYKSRQKALRNARFLAEPRETTTGGQKSWDIRIVFTNLEAKPIAFLERVIPIGNSRVYSLRMAAGADKDGRDQSATLGPLFDAVAAGLKFDPRVTEAPDPAAFHELAAKARGMRLTGVIPTEQYMLTEYEGKPVGWLFMRFERAKFENREGWYLRLRSGLVFADKTRVRLKAWAFTTEDWSREAWHAAEIREAADGKAETVFEENGARTGSAVEVRLRTPDAGEKRESFTVPANYLPAAVEPALCVLAARDGKGEYYFALHEPTVRTMEYVLVPGKAEEIDRVKVLPLLRRVPGRTTGSTQYFDDAGRTVWVKAPEQPTRRAVDKATLIKTFPGSTDLNQ